MILGELWITRTTKVLVYGALPYVVCQNFPLHLLLCSFSRLVGRFEGMRSNDFVLGIIVSRHRRSLLDMVTVEVAQLV